MQSILFNLILRITAKENQHIEKNTILKYGRQDRLRILYTYEPYAILWPDQNLLYLKKIGFLKFSTKDEAL